jgi:hypothetical protein
MIPIIHHTNATSHLRTTLHHTTYYTTPTEKHKLDLKVLAAAKSDISAPVEKEKKVVTHTASDKRTTQAYSDPQRCVCSCRV